MEEHEEEDSFSNGINEKTGLLQGNHGINGDLNGGNVHENANGNANGNVNGNVNGDGINGVKVVANGSDKNGGFDAYDSEKSIQERGLLSTTEGVKLLFSTSWPVILTFVMEMLPGLINVIAVGHLGELELAAVAIASMFCNVVGLAVGFGMASAMDTLCSQANGADNKKAIGVVLQRALIIEFLLCIPIGILFFFSEPILLGMGQEPEVAEYAGSYCRILLICLYPIFVYECLKKYLQAQKIVKPQFVISVICNIYTIIANYVFIYPLGLGFIGSAVARATTYILFPIMAFLYIRFYTDYKESWGGWSMECFKEWKQFFKLGIPGMLMLSLEWWAFEIMAVLSGILGTTELAVHSIIMNICSITFFFPYGISVAASILIGNYLGEVNGMDAKKIAHTALQFAVGIEIVNAILLFTLRDYIPRMFTKDEDVIEMAASVFPIAAAFQIFDGIQATSGGVLRGCGRQVLGAAYNFVAYYIIGLPLASVFAFVLDFGLQGLWGGVAIALSLAAVTAVTIVLKTNWEKQVQDALERVAQTLS